MSEQWCSPLFDPEQRRGIRVYSAQPVEPHLPLSSASSAASTKNNSGPVPLLLVLHSESAKACSLRSTEYGARYRYYYPYMQSLVIIIVAAPYSAHTVRLIHTADASFALVSSDYPRSLSCLPCWVYKPPHSPPSPLLPSRFINLCRFIHLLLLCLHRLAPRYWTCFSFLSSVKSNHQLLPRPSHHGQEGCSFWRRQHWYVDSLKPPRQTRHG